MELIRVGDSYVMLWLLVCTSSSIRKINLTHNVFVWIKVMECLPDIAAVTPSVNDRSRLIQAQLARCIPVTAAGAPLLFIKATENRCFFFALHLYLAQNVKHPPFEKTPCVQADTWSLAAATSNNDSAAGLMLLKEARWKACSSNQCQVLVWSCYMATHKSQYTEVRTRYNSNAVNMGTYISSQMSHWLHYGWFLHHVVLAVPLPRHVSHLQYSSSHGKTVA